jgi:hypothetical protein
MDKRIEREVRSMLVTMQEEYRRLRDKPPEDLTEEDYAVQVARAVDALQELEAIGDGTTTYRIR